MFKAQKGIKGIVHPKMKISCLSAYPKGIKDVGDFVSSVEHKRRFLTQTVAVCQSYNGSQLGPTALRDNKTYTDKTKLNLAARDNTLRSKDTKRLVCARNWTVFILFFTSDPPLGPTVLSSYLSNGPLTLLIEIVDRVSMLHLRDRWR